MSCMLLAAKNKKKKNTKMLMFGCTHSIKAKTYHNFFFLIFGIFEFVVASLQKCCKLFQIYCPIGSRNLCGTHSGIFDARKRQAIGEGFQQC